MAHFMSEALASARNSLAHGAHRGLEWCGQAAHGVARLPHRLLHR